MSGLSELPIRARHLPAFDCVICGPVDHLGRDDTGTALQIGEVLVCWECLCRMLLGNDGPDESEGCPRCWPTVCPGDGNVSWSREEHWAHVEACHADRR